METHLTSGLRNADLAHSITEAVDILNFVCLILSDVDLPAGDHMMEEYGMLEDMLRKLGVLVPERALDLLPETCEEVTDDRIVKILKDLQFESGHAALAAQDQVKELHVPLKRLVRAARIHRAVALAAARSYECRDRLARVDQRGK